MGKKNQRVWLNRTYATNYHLVRMLKEPAEGRNRTVEVTATHPDTSSPVLLAADHAATEPENVTDAEYVNWATRFAADNSIDVFMPVAYQHAIASAEQRFNQIGTQIISSPPESIHLLEDKAETYREAAALHCPVPDYATVTTLEQFDTAYSALRSTHSRLCIKPVKGVGGQGFRIISEKKPEFFDITTGISPTINLDELRTRLSTRDHFDPIMVLPYMPGEETSVDILAINGMIVSATPRTKNSNNRTVRLEARPELDEPTLRLAWRFQLHGLVNIQYRYDTDGNPMLLEINTRPSGGLFQSCAAAGNLPAMMLSLLTDPRTHEAAQAAAEAAASSGDLAREGSELARALNVFQPEMPQNVTVLPGLA